MSRHCLLLFVATCALSACNGSDTTITVLPTTAIVIDPAQFLGNVACLDAPGALHEYVATLVDISANNTFPKLADGGVLPLDGLILPSSPPTPCTETVLFERLLVGREYVGFIQGYDRDEIMPLATGSPTMVDSVTKAYVPPRWQTSCGRELAPTPPPKDAGLDAGLDAIAPPPKFLDGGPVTPVNDTLDAESTFFGCVGPDHQDSGRAPFLGGPVCALEYASITMTGCAPFATTSKTTTPTGITVDLADALAGLSCGDGPGRVKQFSVSLGGASASTQTANCGSAVEFDGLASGAGYTFDVTATSGEPDAGTNDAGDASVVSDAGTTTRWTTRCYREAVDQVVVRAACDPLKALD
jgi:hypothetical protein